MNLGENTMNMGMLIQADDSVQDVRSFAQLHERLLALIRTTRGSIDRPPKTTVVFGPISPKNGRTVADNLQALTNAGLELVKQGWVVIDIASFDDLVLRLGQQNGLNDASTPAQVAEYLIEHFTEPLMRSGYLHAVHFMPNWRESHGATREHELAERIDIDIFEVAG